MFQKIIIKKLEHEIHYKKFCEKKEINTQGFAPKSIVYKVIFLKEKEHKFYDSRNAP